MAAGDACGEVESTKSVSDLYAPLDASGAARDDQLLLVASDRLSAFDFILDSPIPDKGEVLTRLSLWWFAQLEEDRAKCLPFVQAHTDAGADLTWFAEAHHRERDRRELAD